MILADLSSRHSITDIGTPAEIPDGPFGNPAVRFLSGDGYSIGGALDDFAFPGAFTIELLVRGAVPTDELRLLSSRSGVNGWDIRASGINVYIGCRDANGVAYTGFAAAASGNIADGTWKAIALQRTVDGFISVYITGTRVLGPTQIPTMPFGDGLVLTTGVTSPFDLGGVRITKGVARYSGASYTPAAFAFGASDPHWASTVLAGSVPAAATTGYAITSVTKSTVQPGGDWLTYDGTPSHDVSGTLTQALGAGEVLEVSLDGGATWTVATVAGLTWSFADPTTHTASWAVQVRSKTSVGDTGPVVSASVAYRDWPSVAISSMDKDDGVVGDWLTSNGSAPRKVYGSLTAPLLPDEVLQTSFDGGVNWTLATVLGMSWQSEDSLAHTASWTIQAQLSNPTAGASAPVTSVAVTLVPPQPTVLPQGTYTTLLDIIRRFMERTGLPKPAFSIGNTDTQVAQILGLLEEATEEIVMRNARGWQILNRQAIFQTKAQEVQGSLSELAPGFRAIINDTLFNRTTRLPIYGPLLPMERQATKALQTAGPYYRYWIANDELHFYPIPPAGQTIAFEYTSTAAWSDGKTPTTYSEYPDSDTAICLFPKPVMIAQLRWRWKKEKGLEYAEDFAMAERLLNAAIAADGTRRVVDLGGTELVARPGIMIPTGSWPLK